MAGGPKKGSSGLAGSSKRGNTGGVQKKDGGGGSKNKGGDFKKKKVKLGKKIAKADNHTDLTIRSATLFVSSQGLQEEKGDQVTARRQTLKQLLTQV